MKEERRIFGGLLLLWMALDLVQAFFMEIHADEAYYALYGAALDWGYFDHPPVVGWMAGLSSVFFNGNLGVRFMTVLVHALTVMLVWKTVRPRFPQPREIGMFFLLSSSLVMFQAYGFITSPDPFLLFFTAAFLAVYQEFLKRETWHSTVLLGVTMAGLVYSKYQGVLVILFVLVSHLRLLKNGRAWVAVLISVILFLPHIRWQWINDFPSLRYHLVDRSTGFSPVYFLEYLPNQLVVFNPVVLFFLVRIVCKRKSRDLFERACRSVSVGLIVFFWLMTWKGHAEPHWTVAASVPLIVLLYAPMVEDRKSIRTACRLLTPMCVLILLARIAVLFPVLPSRLGLGGKEERYLALKEQMTEDLPVIFSGSFQNPSLMTYFTGCESTVLSSVTSRITQFDLWRMEEKWQGQPVWLVTENDVLMKVEDFQSVNRLHAEFLSEMSDEPFFISPGDTLSVSFRIFGKLSYPVDFHHAELPVTPKLVLLHRRDCLFCDGEVSLSSTRLLPAGESVSQLEGRIECVIPEKVSELGEGKLGLVLDNGFCAPLVSETILFRVKE